jgi:hypothetical protein
MTLQNCIYANNLVSSYVVTVRTSPNSPESYLMRTLVDQLNKILEILGASSLRFPSR